MRFRLRRLGGLLDECADIGFKLGIRMGGVVPPLGNGC